MIIGIGYKKYSGKDTLATMIAESFGKEAAITHFADALKEQVASACDISLAELNQNKDVFRPILQWWGTEFKRKYRGNDNYWVEQVAVKVEILERDFKKNLILISDVRFPNEANWIKEAGGKLIHINRPGLHSLDTHPSETSLDGYDKWDMTVTNDGTKEELLQKARGIINSLIVPNL